MLFRSDVIPFVPLGDTPMNLCVDLAHRLGERIGRELEIPVFFYEEAARAAKEDVLEAVHRILCIHLGTPPSSFDWQWNDKDREFHRDGAMTPRRFADRYVTLPLDEYVGVYSDSLYGTVRVAERDSTLHLHYGPGLQGPLEHWNYDTFRVSWEATWRGTDLVTFRVSPRGEAAVLELDGAAFARERPQR